MEKYQEEIKWKDNATAEVTIHRVTEPKRQNGQVYGHETSTGIYEATREELEDGLKGMEISQKNALKAYDLAKQESEKLQRELEQKKFFATLNDDLIKLKLQLENLGYIDRKEKNRQDVEHHTQELEQINQKIAARRKALDL